MTAEDRGWGPAGCTADQLVRVEVGGMLDSKPFFPLRVRVEVAPLFAELCRWLVAERARVGVGPLTCSGGYNKRPVRGTTDTWSEHSWALAGDFCAATNPMQRVLRTDMPPGTSAKAKSLGMRWGGDYSGRKDPMHFEFMGTPGDARRLVKALIRPASTTPAPRPPATAPTASTEDDDMKLIRCDGRPRCLLTMGRLWPLNSNAQAEGYLAAGIVEERLTPTEWDKLDGASKHLAGLGA